MLSALIQSRLRYVYFEDLEYKTGKILGHIAILHDNIDSLADVFNTMTNMITNKNLSILTVLTVGIGIMTMVSGIYGMNVDLPIQNNQSAFLILMGIMLSLTLITFFVFKKKKWY